MGFCGSCQHNATQPAAPAELLQIREGYRAQWNSLTFSVETDSSQWTLRVQDAQHAEAVYTAHRAGVEAAQVAAAEFGIFQTLGPDSPISPTQLAHDLTWQRYW
jgi:hypothetical protein